MSQNQQLFRDCQVSHEYQVSLNHWLPSSIVDILKFALQYSSSLSKAYTIAFIGGLFIKIVFSIHFSSDSILI